MDTITMTANIQPSTYLTEEDRADRRAKIMGDKSKRTPLTYFFDLKAEDIQPVDYQDCDFKDFDITRILNSGFDATNGNIASYWVQDKALTKNYRAQAMERIEEEIQQASESGDHNRVDELIAEAKTVSKVKAYVPDFPIAFDIETTAVTEYEKQKDGREKCVKAEAYTYHWQTLIDTTIVHCHSWEEQMKLFTMITEHLNTDVDVTSLGIKLFAKVWDANLGYEFAFMNQHLERAGHHITRTFSRTTHNPITAQTDTGLMFVDALKLTNSSLEKISKLYNLPTKKTHDLDYSKPRNTKTKLTDEELYYCSADVRILGDFHRWLYENYTLHALETPLTSTGIVRHDVKALFYEMQGGAKQWKKKTDRERKATNFAKYKLPELLVENYDDYYDLVTMGFSGGFTQGSSLEAGNILKDVNGGDFTSSYPYCDVFEKFPMSKWTEAEVHTLEEIKDMMNKGRAVMMKITMKNVTLKDGKPFGAWSASKTYEYKENKGINGFIKNESAIIDNGKVIYADHMTVHITELDLQTLLAFYDFELETVHFCKWAKMDYLPDYVRAAVFMYYQKKAVLKKQGLDETTEYKLAKACVNSIYGLMCQKTELGDIVFSPNSNAWATIMPDDEDIDRKYRESVFGKEYDGKKPPKTILSPYWAVYTTARARRRLFELIEEIGDDVLYCDTDSIYFKNPDKYDSMMADYNKKIRWQNMAKVDDWNTEHGFDRGQYDLMPPEQAEEYLRKTFGILYENVVDLGEFDKLNKHGNYTRFKTLGAKRYLKEDESGNIVQTIAGLPKTAMIDYCKENNLDPFEFFNDGMIIPKCKKGHRYNDYEHSAVIKDEDGNIELMTELSSVGIFEIDFSMKLSSEYAILIESQVQELRRKDYRGFIKEMKERANA